MKNKISTLLMEAGVSYNKQKLHKAGYFRELLETNPDINEDYVRCCECVARRWCACREPRVRWCDHWSVIRCWWIVWSG